MRDGVRLATNIYRPAENGKVVEGKFPVILERTPYGKDNDVYYADTGSSRICCHTPGRTRSIQFGSTGNFFRDDINDGYDTASGLAPTLVNCAIGTVGASYPAEHSMHSLCRTRHAESDDSSVCDL